MSKKVFYLFLVVLIMFSLCFGFLHVPSNDNEAYENLNNVCFSRENVLASTDILIINNKYMIVNGAKKEIDPGRATVPVIINGRTLVPIRAIVEALGGTVDWSASDKKVTIKLNNTTIELWIDKKTAKVNGTSKELDVPPMILNGRTMLPIRFVTEELGCTVDWENKTKTVTITYNL